MLFYFLGARTRNTAGASKHWENSATQLSAGNSEKVSDYIIFVIITIVSEIVPQSFHGMHIFF